MEQLSSSFHVGISYHVNDISIETRVGVSKVDSLLQIRVYMVMWLEPRESTQQYETQVETS